MLLKSFAPRRRDTTGCIADIMPEINIIAGKKNDPPTATPARSEVPTIPDIIVSDTPKRAYAILPAKIGMANLII